MRDFNFIIRVSGVARHTWAWSGPTGVIYPGRGVPEESKRGSVSHFFKKISEKGHL